MGEELRSKYHGIDRRMLCTVLARRRCPVLVTFKAVRTWLEQYVTPVLKKPAQSVSRACKRPAAAVSDKTEKVLKRQRTEEVLGEPSSGSVLQPLTSALEVERHCGMRDRREYTDLGLGLQGQGEMPRILASWGYSVKPFVCRSWVSQYSLEGAHEMGNLAVFQRSRTDLRTWYYVDKLTCARIQDKYLQEHGVYAHHEALMYWLRAPEQQPERLENDNVSLHTHACGEYILEQLQNGRRERIIIPSCDTSNRPTRSPHMASGHM